MLNHLWYMFTVVFTEVDFHNLVLKIYNIGIKHHEMPVTDWLYITRYVRIYISFAYQHDVWNTSG